MLPDECAKEAVQNYPEIYFAKVVVIGEGDGEDILLGHTMKVMNFDFDYNVLTFGPPECALPNIEYCQK